MGGLRCLDGLAPRSGVSRGAIGLLLPWEPGCSAKLFEVLSGRQRVIARHPTRGGANDRAEERGEGEVR